VEVAKWVKFDWEGGQNSDSTCAGSNSALIRFGMNCMHGTHWINT
jgi:hypothetical protein